MTVQVSEADIKRLVALGYEDAGNHADSKVMAKAVEAYLSDTLGW